MFTRTALVGCAMSAAFAASAVAQVPVPSAPAEMQLRLVRQAGTLPGAITDVDINSTYAATPGEVVRFELQYRVLDLNLTDDVVPAGLSAAGGFNIVSDTAGYRFRRAQLSMFEAQLAATDPPGPVDTSGLPTGTAVVRRGMHVPFRGGFANSNNNSLPANGTFTNGNNGGGVNATEGDAITNLVAISIGAPNQGNANLGLDNTAWYGLYSFDVVVGAADTTIRGVLYPDPVTGVKYTFFNDGFAIPLQMTNGIDAAYAITVPAPAAGVILLIAAAPRARRRR